MLPSEEMHHAKKLIRYLEKSYGLGTKKSSGDTVDYYVLSYSMDVPFSAGYALGHPWNYRFQNLWVLNGVENFVVKNREKMSKKALMRHTRPLRQLVINTVTEDIRRNRPDILLVDTKNKGPRWSRKSRDLIRFFASDAEFASLMAQYDLKKRFLEYDIYQRKQKD